MSKGLITLAYGDVYCAMAKHLYQSYRLYGNCDYPFYVITDIAGYKKYKLGRIFDGIIVRDDLTRSTVDKILAFTDTPFDETIFIDADSSVVNHIDRVFKLFEDNGSPVSAIAGCVELTRDKGIQFSPKAIKTFNIKHDFPNFNGGVYYYKKTPEGKACVDFMLNELKPHYEEYLFMGKNDSAGMADEPLVIVGMLRYGFRPIPQTSDVMYLVHNGNEVRWDMDSGTSSYHYYEQLVHPTIIHWKFGGTETHNYKRYDARLRHKYLKTSYLKYLTERLMLICRYDIYAKLNWLHLFLAKLRRWP